MEILALGVVCLSLVGALVYLQKLNAETLKKIRAIEKAKDLREVHEYIIPQEHELTPDIVDKTISIEDLEADDLHKILEENRG